MTRICFIALLFLSVFSVATSWAEDGWHRTDALTIHTIPGRASGGLVAVRYNVTNTFDRTVHILVVPNATPSLDDGKMHNFVKPHTIVTGTFIVRPDQLKSAALYYKYP